MKSFPCLFSIYLTKPAPLIQSGQYSINEFLIAGPGHQRVFEDKAVAKIQLFNVLYKTSQHILIIFYISKVSTAVTNEKSVKEIVLQISNLNYLLC